MTEEGEILARDWLGDTRKGSPARERSPVERMRKRTIGDDYATPMFALKSRRLEGSKESDPNRHARSAGNRNTVNTEKRNMIDSLIRDAMETLGKIQETVKTNDPSSDSEAPDEGYLQNKIRRLTDLNKDLRDDVTRLAAKNNMSLENIERLQIRIKKKQDENDDLRRAYRDLKDANERLRERVKKLPASKAAVLDDEDDDEDDDDNEDNIINTILKH